MIDKLLARRGYKKTLENGYGAVYEKDEPQNFTHAITIDHKMDRRPLIHSYDKTTHERNSVGFTPSCGMECSVCFLILLKSVWLRIKYWW